MQRTPQKRGPKPREQMYVANDSGVVVINGADVYFKKNVTRVAESDELRRAAPQMFTAIPGEFRIEQATAAPGEERDR